MAGIPVSIVESSGGPDRWWGRRMLRRIAAGRSRRPQCRSARSRWPCHGQARPGCLSRGCLATGPGATARAPGPRGACC
ncbi:hypothetical protein G6F40_017130 [Rhizopus arrhizus]|nr:hypothetical protein G6F40_017130 [Rhizopus arrhizus]